MSKFIVKMIYKEVIEVEVEAETEEQARQIADSDKGYQIDYFLHDIEAREAA